VSKRYSFVTVWHVGADVEAVWQAIVEVEQWPEWWPSLRSVVAVAPGDERGIDAVYRFTWRGRLPYRLSFDMKASRVEPYKLLEGMATGELEGAGTWRFLPEGRTTRIRYEWVVATRKWWMNLLSPLLRPAYRWNHDRVMAEGGEGLAKRLNCDLLGISHESTVNV
jgi:hypothetical protein